MENQTFSNSPSDNLKATYKRTLIIYVLSLCFIIAFIVSTFVLEKRILISENKYAKIINLSGRQRMLSQRIALLVSKTTELNTSKDIENNNDKIKKNLHELESIISLLSFDNSQQKLTVLNSPYSKKLLKDNENILNDFISSTYHFMENQSDWKNHPAQKIAIQHIQNLALEPILTLFDNLTSDKQIQADLIIQKIDNLKAIMTSITLLLLLLETFFIFFPLAKSNLKMGLQNISQHDKELKVKNFIELGQVISKIVHEINNPLTVVMIKLKTLKKHNSFNPDVNQALDIVDKNILRVVKIIKSTKSIYRMGKNDELTAVHLKQVIEDSIEATKILRDVKNLNVEFSADKDILIKAQEHQIFQVLMNLITNAVDATENQTQQNISILLKAEGNGALIRISDNGPGVPTQLDQKIFEQLYTTKSHGTGIGLHESKMIVEAYSGTIQLNRAISNSTFEIFFPVTLSDQSLST